jgi:RNA polymerase sigma-70 factor (ECF subfamily)
MPADPHDVPSDEERLGRWVQEHAPAVLGFLRGTLRRQDIAEELLQETFCRAWEARGRYVDSGKERAYLLTIADRLACDRARRSGREILLDDEGWSRAEPRESGQPADRLVRQESVRQLELAMESLGENQRRVLLLRYYGEFPFHEIARMTGWPLNTVLSHCRRGLLALREVLIEDLS